MKVKVLFKHNQPPIVFTKIESVNMDLVRGFLLLYTYNQVYVTPVYQVDVKDLRQKRAHAILIEDLLDFSVYVEDPSGLNDPLTQGKSFWVLKIKVREKIVADGIDDPAFSMERKGKYLNAAQMNEMLNDPNTIVIDMRNHYEYEVGHFANAVEIPSDTFREQLPMAVEMLQGKEDKNVLMYRLHMQITVQHLP